MSNTWRTQGRRSVREATFLMVPIAFAFIPVLGMLWTMAPFAPPPGVSLARISILLTSAVVMLYILLRSRCAANASNVLGVPLLVLGFYPSAYAAATILGLADTVISCVYLAIALISGGLAARLSADTHTILHGVLRAIALAVIVFAGGLVYRTYVKPAPYAPAVQHAVERLSSPLTVPQPARSKPDVYHLVLDGMGRADVLEKDYGLSLNEQLESLRHLGFTIAPNGQANYVQTQLSLASMLNVDYLDDLAAAEGTGAHRRPLIHLISHARVPAVFKELGYYIEFIGSGYLSSGAFERADHCDCPQLWFADAELATLTLSPLQVAVGATGSRAHYRRSLAVFDALERPRSGAAPRFVFAHVPMPHPPFVADDRGEFTGPSFGMGGTGDGSFFAGSPYQYKSGYQAQTRFTLSRTLRALTRIVQQGAREGRDVVIIVHGDHGPRLGFDFRNPSADSGQRVLPVLLAMRWPAGRAPKEQPQSLVNVYRALFTHAFGLDLPILPDRGYVSGFINPYVMSPVSAAGTGGTRTH